MAIEAIAIGIFLFVALTVGGLRSLDAMRRRSAERAKELTHYTGPRYNEHGRELESK